MRNKILLGLSLLIASVHLDRPVTGQQNPPAPVVLISIDGLKPDYVIEADKNGLKVPNLRRLVSEGAYSTGVIGVLPTVTYPSHTTLVTGVSPAKHGVIANTPFDPFGKNISGWYWYAEDLKTPTLWDAARAAGMVTASVDWPATVSANITYNIPQYWRAGTPDDRKLTRALSTPGLLTEIERVVGNYPEGKDYSTEADERRVLFNVYLLEKKKPRFQTVYFSALDHEQHDFGPYSPQAKAALERIDTLVGKVREAAEKGGGGSAVICVASDHGFALTEHEVRLNAALRDAGLIEVDKSGVIRSWRAFAWSSAGSAAVLLKDAGDEDARKKVRAVLTGLLADPANGLLKIYEGNALKALGGFPDAAFVVGARPGYYLGGGHDGPILRAGKRGGTHGFLPEVAEMNSAFFIAGPGVPKGRNLGQIDMRDIAPTLAGILKVALPGAEGRDLFR